jgi:toxin-antitoxin system PIN domain toxin
MNIVDVNVLVYAANRAAQQHKASMSWLGAAVNGSRGVLIPWVAILGFVRLATHPRVLGKPLDAASAWGFVDRLTAAPAVRVPVPAPGHQATAQRLHLAAGGGSRLVTDAHIAALALENGADVVTWDTDFALFPGVTWGVPGADGA